jgi:hypothetical protein
MINVFIAVVLKNFEEEVRHVCMQTAYVFFI